MDPLSITTGVITILSVTYNVGVEIKKFRDDVSSVDVVLETLITDVESLHGVLETMQETLNKAGTRSTLQLTGHIGNHWRNMERSLEDSQRVLSELLVLFQDINKSVSFLDGPRKVRRYRAMSERIQRYSNQISSYKDTLNLSLQTLVL